MNEGSMSAMARSAVLRTVRFWWNRFGEVVPESETVMLGGIRPL